MGCAKRPAADGLMTGRTVKSARPHENTDNHMRDSSYTPYFQGEPGGHSAGPAPLAISRGFRPCGADSPLRQAARLHPQLHAWFPSHSDQSWLSASRIQSIR
jgi:hypothetical protein